VIELHDELVIALAGRYVLERQLGHGGMAVVYLAHDARNGRKIALKVMRPQLADSLGAERFLQEIAIAAPLVHPNIVSLYDSGEASGFLYYTMPYVEGQTLRHRLEREVQLPIEDALSITRQVASALDYAHSHGAVHRDIKPENILLQGDHAFVADFGLARAITRSASRPLTTQGIVVGTPPYMSPEQCTPGGIANAASDIYSLGCVVFEMIAGMPPFRGATADVIMSHHQMSPPPSLREERSSCPSAFDAAVRRALAKVPADRFRTAGEFVSALQSPVMGNQLTERVLDPRTRTASDVDGLTPSQNRRTMQYLAALAVAMVLLLAGVWAVKKLPQGSNPAGASYSDAARHIAVLYFDDLTPGKELSYVAAGLTENLIDQLSQVPGLRVVSPNGVRSLRDSDLSIDTLAHRLNVGTIISGSVSRSGSMLRLSVRLIDATTGEQLHSRTFERPSWNFFDLQDSLTTDVAFSLRQRLGREIRIREQQSNATSVESWELVHRGEELAARATELTLTGDPRALGLLRQADSAYVQAERLDPQWVVPAVNRAKNALAMAFIEPSLPDNDKARTIRLGLARAIAHAERALLTHPALPELLAVRGEARLRLATLGDATAPDSLLELARGDLQKAASTRPDMARTWYLLGDLYLHDGRYADAADAYKSAYDADAFLTDIRAVLNGLFFSNLNAGQFEEARRWCRSARNRYPEDPRFAECELFLLGWSGRTHADVESAWRILRSIESNDTTGILAFNSTFRRMMVAAVIARSGMRDSARHVLTRTRGGDKPPAHFAEAYVQVLLGDHQTAIRLLREILTKSPHARASIAHTLWFKDLHNEPDFQALFVNVK
jgi:serine/threonine-protein kinase